MSAPKGALSVIAILLSLVSTVDAHASLADLARLLRSPLGRLVMTRTDEGAEIAGRVLGRAATEADIDLLAARFAQTEFSAHAGTLEQRLVAIQERLALEAGAGLVGDDLIAALRRISARKLEVKDIGNGAFKIIKRRTPTIAEELKARLLEPVPDEAVVPAPLGKDFGGRHLTKLEANGADLRLSSFTDAQAMGAKASDATLAFSDLRRARLDGSEMISSDLTGVIADGASFRQANLRNSVLRDSSLKGANLDRADLSGADLRGADLTDAHLWNAGFRARTDISTNFKGAFYDKQTKLPFDKKTADRLGMLLVTPSA